MCCEMFYINYTLEIPKFTKCQDLTIFFSILHIDVTKTPIHLQKLENLNCLVLHLSQTGHQYELNV